MEKQTRKYIIDADGKKIYRLKSWWQLNIERNNEIEASNNEIVHGDPNIFIWYSRRF